MSRAYDPSSDYNNYWVMGQSIWFDGPGGQRLYGQISRIYFGDPGEILVDVGGERYEVNLRNDNPMIDWSRE